MHIHILPWVLLIITGKRLRNFAADKGQVYLSNGQILMSFLERLYMEVSWNWKKNCSVALGVGRFTRRVN